MSMAFADFPAPRVAPNAAHAFGGIWRLTSRRFMTPGYWLMLAALLGLLVLLSFPTTHSRAAAAQGFLPWAAGFYVCFIVPVVTFLFAAGAARDDLGTATADYVLTRPLPRHLLTIFRCVAHVACGQIDFAFGLAVIAGIGAFHGVPGLGSALPLLLLAQVMAVITFTALGFLCGMLTSRYVIVGLAYGAIVEIGIGSVPTPLNQISLLRQLLGILRPVVGSGDGALMRAAMTSTLGPSATVAVLLVFSAAAIALTAIIFRWKEFAGDGAREI
jgi:ABC-type transport system involved in multi-copper enzyme maturation permease subunit